MKLGFLTGCLDMPLREKLEYASKSGFDTVEISCWPKENERDYSASDIDVKNFSETDAKDLNSLLKKCNLEISSLAYYDNMLHPDLEKREVFHSHLKNVIRAAEKLNVELVGTFVGKDPNLSIEENFDLYEKIFSELVLFAERHNVKLMIENCPMPGWDVDGLPSTISYSPEFWDEMFKRIPSKNFGLNFDPSHLAWLRVDYNKCIKNYKDRIFHVHAKDCTLSNDGLSYYGIFGKKLNRSEPEDLGIFTPKIPGLGDISWPCFIDNLREIGYDGYVSIEHEDRDFEKDNDEVILGLNYAFNHLNPLIREFNNKK